MNMALFYMQNRSESSTFLHEKIVVKVEVFSYLVAETKD
jgi:hypothetical protein